jgi:hypothetical protein
MSDPIDQILETNPTRLAGLFAIGAPSADWTPEQMQDALEHLLILPFEIALSQLPLELADKLRAFAEALQFHPIAQRAQIRTCAELFRHPKPPIELLRFVKEFGKAIQTHEHTACPAEIGAVVYYCSLGAALVHQETRIGRLSDEEMREGFGKLTALPWLDETSRGLFAASLMRLGTA